MQEICLLRQLRGRAHRERIHLQILHSHYGWLEGNKAPRLGALSRNRPMSHMRVDHQQTGRSHTERCRTGKGGTTTREGLGAGRFLGDMSNWSKQSRHKRGYGSYWDKLRLRILARDNYLCQCPRCLGGKLRLMPATEVDHILPKANGGTDDPGNLRSVSGECHKRISLEQRGVRPRPRIGLDGWPLNE